MRKAEMYNSVEGGVKNANFDPSEYRRIAMQAQSGTAAGSKPRVREGVTEVFHMQGADIYSQKIANRSLNTIDIQQKKSLLRRRDYQTENTQGSAAGIRMGSPN